MNPAGRPRVLPVGVCDAPEIAEGDRPRRAAVLTMRTLRVAAAWRQAAHRVEVEGARWRAAAERGAGEEGRAAAERARHCAERARVWRMAAARLEEATG